MHGAGPLHTARVLLTYCKGFYERDAEGCGQYLHLSHALTSVADACSGGCSQGGERQKPQFQYGFLTWPPSDKEQACACICPCLIKRVLQLHHMIRVLERDRPLSSSTASQNKTWFNSSTLVALVALGTTQTRMQQRNAISARNTVCSRRWQEVRLTRRSLPRTRYETNTIQNI